MPNPLNIRRKLTKKVINNLGMDTILQRASSGQILDAYGEPTAVWGFDNINIRIVIDTDKRDAEQTEIGALQDKKREFIHFFCSGNFDIRIGDRILYPAGTNDVWFVDLIQPTVIQNVPVILEVKAYRDGRY